MKKHFLMFIIIFLCLSLVSCGGKKPDYLSDEMYEYGIAALEIADDYLSGDISADDAYKRLSSNYVLTDARCSLEAKNSSDDNHAAYASIVSSEILNLKYAVQNKSKGIGTDNDIKEKRNAIADTLGK